MFLLFLPVSPVETQGCFSDRKPLLAGERNITDLFCHEKPLGKCVFAKSSEKDKGLS